MIYERIAYDNVVFGPDKCDFSYIFCNLTWFVRNTSITILRQDPIFFFNEGKIYP